jgi:glycosyltransferase involved in cell wall biosynthesis
MSADVTVVIPTFNRADKVKTAVASVLEQTVPAREIVVVDDGSEDNTLEVLEPFSGRITVLKHSRNLGVSAARNTGIRAGDASLVAFLDSDDRWLPRKLEAQTSFFRENPGAVACQTQEIWVRGGRRVNPARKHLKRSGDIFQASLKRCLVSPSAVVLRRSLLDEVGLFDETLPVCEDYDLWLRVSCRHPVHLIDAFHLVREGGRPDQLSARGPGMDRYRVRAILKLLREEKLTSTQRLAAEEELSRKCSIYGRGCIKRGRVEEGLQYLRLGARRGRPDLTP